MFLRDSHIEKAVRIFFREPFEPRSIRHRRCHRHDLRIFRCQTADFSGKYICIARMFLFPERFSRFNIKWFNSVKCRRILLRRTVSLALFRNHMDQHRAVDLFRLAENTDQPLNIMSIHRSQIRDSHIFKPHARNQKLLDAVLCPEQRADQIRTDHRDPR